jgi:hypothetical protein
MLPRVTVALSPDCGTWTFSGFPVYWVRFSISARCAATEFDHSRPVDSQHGETLDLAGPKLAALPSASRTPALVVHRI